MLECEQLHRKTRRGRGKPDPIDAHLAVLTVLRLDAAVASIGGPGGGARLGLVEAIGSAPDFG